MLEFQRQRHKSTSEFDMWNPSALKEVLYDPTGFQMEIVLFSVSTEEQIKTMENTSLHNANAEDKDRS